MLVGACGVPASDDAVDTTRLGETPGVSTLLPTTVPDVSEPDSGKAIAVDADAAIKDLARRLDIDEGQIEVVRAEAVTWPDGSMGCPKEGESYTQAFVDGSQVVLRVDDRMYDYHAGEDGSLFLCPSDEKDGGYEFVPKPGIDD